MVDARCVVEVRRADDKGLAEERVAWFAAGDGQGRTLASGVGGGRADEVAMAGAQVARVGLAGRHRQVERGRWRSCATTVLTGRDERQSFGFVASKRYLPCPRRSDTPELRLKRIATVDNATTLGLTDTVLRTMFQMKDELARCFVSSRKSHSEHALMSDLNGSYFAI